VEEVRETRLASGPVVTQDLWELGNGAEQLVVGLNQLLLIGSGQACKL
jgi:hypothetical protein